MTQDETALEHQLPWVTSRQLSGQRDQCEVPHADLGAARHRLPAVREIIADLRASWLGALHLVFALTALEDLVDAGDTGEETVLFHRFMVNAAKYACSVDASTAVRRGIGVLGGKGTIEEFSVLPRLYRDSIVYEAWEGTHNVLVAQVLTDLRRLPILDVVAGRLAGPCRTAGDPTAEQALAQLDRALAEARMAVDDPDHGARFFRHTLDRLMTVARAAYLLDGGEELAARHLLAALGPDPEPAAAVAARIDALAGSGGS